MKLTSISLLFVLLTSLMGTQGHAQSLGVDFSKMPVGTKMYYTQSNGDKWTEVYKGKKRGKHVMVRYKGHSKTTTRPLQTQNFDAQGRMLFYRAPGERSTYKISFRPYNCFYAFGPCKHTARFSGGEFEGDGSTEKLVLDTRKAKGGYITTWYKTRTSSQQNAFFSEMGQFNLRALEAWGSKGQYTIKLVKVVTP